jgi:hypothetical protein
MNEMPLKALCTFGGGARLTDEALRAFERRHQIRLPTAYRAFLEATNGGRPARDLFAVRQGPADRIVRVRFFFGLEEIVSPCNLGWVREVLAPRLPSELLAVATTDQADKLCISLSGRAVFLWEVHSEVLMPVAPSFEDYIEGLYRDAESPTATSSVWAIRKYR